MSREQFFSVPFRCWPVKRHTHTLFWRLTGLEHKLGTGDLLNTFLYVIDRHLLVTGIHDNMSSVSGIRNVCNSRSAAILGGSEALGSGVSLAGPAVELDAPGVFLSPLTRNKAESRRRSVSTATTSIVKLWRPRHA